MRKKIIIKLSLPVLLFFANLPIYGQSGPNQVGWGSNQINSNVLKPQQNLVDSLVVWQQQVVLHTDKDVVMPKDQLFFKAYVLTGPDQFRVSTGDVLKVELLDEKGTLIRSQYHKITGGTSVGSFEIPKKIKEGNYYLRTYTRWMLNYGPEQFTTKKIRISDTKKRDELNAIHTDRIAFFPEGGHLIAGVTHNILVTFNNHNVDNIPIVNGKGEVVAKVKNYGRGVGTFLLKPEKGEHYSIIFNGTQPIPLPEIRDTGYSIQVNNLNNDILPVRIEASPDLSSETIYLTGRSKGVTYLKTKLDFKEKNVIDIDIAKMDLPKGILHLQLEDEFDEVWAKRSLYIDSDMLKIKVEQLSEKEGNTMLRVKVTDREGRPVQTELSIGIRGKEVRDDGFKGSTLPDLQNTTYRKKRFLNDLLLLTGQSSDDFPGSDISELPSEIRYNFQKGLEFYGQAYDLNNTLLMNTKIQMLITTDDDLVAQETSTNDEGLFKLSGLQINGEASIVFRTVAEETKSRLVKVIPYEYEIPPLGEMLGVDEGNNKKSKLVFPKIPWIDFLSGTDKDKLITLEEVTLIATKPLQKKNPSVYDIEPTRLIYQDKERPRPIPQLFLGIPGIQVVGLGGLSPSLSLPRSAGTGPVLWVVDGFPLIQPAGLIDVINLISYSDIERIEILLGPAASIYGARGSGGVIAIYTRSGSDIDYIDRKEAQLSFAGFHESINFKEYQETILNRVKNRVDIPTTVYWNPELKTDENGEAIIQLSNPLNYSLIEIQANAIAENGARGSLKTVY